MEIQPCFNREVLRDLSDRATTARLDLEAWAEGENLVYEAARPSDRTIGQRVGTEESDVDLQILQAASSGNLASLRELIGRLRSSPNAHDRFTRIFLASMSDSTNEALAVLLESNLVDLQAEDDINERNCLHEAAIYGREFVVDYALREGIDVSRVDAYGRIALHYACTKGRVEMVRKLIQAGPTTLDTRDNDNFTPLIHSIVHHQHACVYELVSHNVRIDPSSESDHVPLNLACQHGSVEVVTLLLEKGARLLPDAEGLYPQHLVARSHHSPDLLLVLTHHGADLNQRDKLYQWTPLFHAASEGRVDCLRCLLLNDAEVDALDEKGLTAMYYATWEGHLECMNLLWERSSRRKEMQASAARSLGSSAAPLSNRTSATMDITPKNSPREADGIPDLSLPPPIIPLRRYGHNFLDTKTLISINFHRGASAIKFFNEGRYPAARITVSSKTSDPIPRNLVLPIQDDSKSFSFQVDDLSSFAVDFEIFPTFGSKVIAKTVALPEVFQGIQTSLGSCCLPLFDPRLRAVGQIQFGFQVIKPYNGSPLDITQFATYWKSTSALDDHSGLVTGSSLSGDYLQLVVQITRDDVPVIFPSFRINHHGLEVPVAHLLHRELDSLRQSRARLPPAGAERDSASISEWYNLLSSSLTTLEEVLNVLPVAINLNLQVLYPSVAEEMVLGIVPRATVNTCSDAILTVVFDHTRALREHHLDLTRSIVFSSANPQVCAALNWKQPNFAVLLSNNLGRSDHLAVAAQRLTDIVAMPAVSLSIKESARVAQNNNLMGLICRSEILQKVPALVPTVQEAGLVLVSDATDLRMRSKAPDDESPAVPDGVNGVLRGDGVLNFNETVDA